MNTDKDIDNLAELSRLELSTEEKASYAKDLNNILSYVGKLSEIKFDSNNFSFTENLNKMRGDEITCETGADTEVLVNESPDRQGNYIKVKKILGQ